MSFDSINPPRMSSHVSPSPSVVHVVLSLDVGGLERVVLDLIRDGGHLGQRVSVLCLERPGTLAGQAEAMGSRVVSAGKRPGLRPGVVRRVAKLLCEVGPDVIHTHQVGALAYAGPAARLAGGMPVVHTEHGKHYAMRWRTRMLGGLAGRFADRFLCVSADIAAEVRRHRIVPERKLGVVPNGIDTGRFSGPSDRDAIRSALGIPKDAPVLGTVGRLNEVKRQDRLIRAFSKASGVILGAHLLLVGDGPLIDDLRDLAAGLGLADRVHFVGYQLHPEKYLATMDLFALTSRSEGMPLAVLEAWAAGIPVIASRVGGLPEMVDHGRTGLLFDQEDEEGLAGLLVSLVGDPARARGLAEQGRREVEAKYSLRGMAEAYHRQYLELMEPGGRTTSRRDLDLDRSRHGPA